MEQLNLTTPISVTDVKVQRLALDWAGKTIYILVIGTDGRTLQFTYDGDVAATLMKQLNTLNLSTKSLHKRLLERLVADGFLSGTISGTPDV
jgi:hypothetical protein